MSAFHIGKDYTASSPPQGARVFPNDDLPNFDLKFDQDGKFEAVLDLDLERYYEEPLHTPVLHYPLSKTSAALVGSKKRKTRAPGRLRPTDFHISQIQGNESRAEISRMRAESKKVNAEMLTEIKKSCENYLSSFTKEWQTRKLSECRQRVKDEATKLYSIVELEGVPLDCPGLTTELIEKRKRKLEREFTQVTDMSLKCVEDAVSCMFDDKMAGPFQGGTLIIGSEGLPKKRNRLPDILPNHHSLSIPSKVRIAHYYNQTHCNWGLPSTSLATLPTPNVHPVQEILEAVATARLGSSNLEYPGRGHLIDKLYLPFLGPSDPTATFVEPEEDEDEDEEEEREAALLEEYPEEEQKEEAALLEENGMVMEAEVIVAKEEPEPKLEPPPHAEEPHVDAVEPAGGEEPMAEPPVEVKNPTPDLPTEPPSEDAKPAAAELMDAPLAQRRTKRSRQGICATPFSP